MFKSVIMTGLVFILLAQTFNLLAVHIKDKFMRI